MCIVYNQSGSLSYILEQLTRKKISEFETLNDILKFQKSIPYLTNSIIERHRTILLSEKSELENYLDSLSNQSSSIPRDHTSSYEKSLGFQQSAKIEMNEVFQQNISENIHPVAFLFGKLFLAIKHIFNYFQLQIGLYKERRHVSKMIKRYQFIETDFDSAIQKSAHRELNELNQKKKILNSLSSYIAGAIGEQKVIEICSQLSDDFILINDFKYRFARSIFYRHANEYISSVQIDHLLITPAGIFVIETKNWSQQTLESSKHFSPALQVKRAGFALYTIIGLLRPTSISFSNKYDWGDFKIPIRNIVLLTNNKPAASFDFVKMLHQNELIGHVKSFNPIITREQSLSIANFFLDISER